MNKKKIKQIRGKLQRSVEELIKAGGFLNGGSPYGASRCNDRGLGVAGVCLLGAVNLRKIQAGASVLTRHEDAARALGIDFHEARAIEFGYMQGRDGVDAPTDLHKLGIELREAYYETADGEVRS